MENKPSKIIWHHTAGMQTKGQAAIVEAMGKKAKHQISRAGYYGAYHILIEKDGTVFRFRDDNEIAYGTAKHNLDALQIVLAGNFSEEYPTQEQENAMKWELHYWCDKYRILTNAIKKHGELENTECPGKLLTKDWAPNLLASTTQSERNKAILQIIDYLKAMLEG